MLSSVGWLFFCVCGVPYFPHSLFIISNGLLYRLNIRCKSFAVPQYSHNKCVCVFEGTSSSTASLRCRLMKILCKYFLHDSPKSDRRGGYGVPVWNGEGCFFLNSYYTVDLYGLQRGAEGGVCLGLPEWKAKSAHPKTYSGRFCVFFPLLFTGIFTSDSVVPTAPAS